MEQLCNICRTTKEEKEIIEDKTVFVICDNCLNGEQLSPLLDQIFLR